MRALLVGGALALATSWPVVAVALWADQPVTVESKIDAGRVAAPTDFRCAMIGLLSATFRWDQVPGATGYVLHYGSGGSQTQHIEGGSATSATVNAVVQLSGTAWVQAKVNSFESPPSGKRNYLGAVVSLCDPV